MITLGYAGINETLRQEHIFTGRTCRESTAIEKGISYLEELAIKNLDDLYKIIEWNIKNNIKFYRIGSDIFPHITNDRLFAILIKEKNENKKEKNENEKKEEKNENKKEEKNENEKKEEKNENKKEEENENEEKKEENDPYTLLYPLEKFQKKFQNIGKLAKSSNMRLTFHPDLFNILNSPTEQVLIRTYRDLFYHTRMLELMELNLDSIIVLHGGGVYNDKKSAIKRWIENFNLLPENIKQRIVLENDETKFSIDDVLFMAKNCIPEIPVILDLFHHYCYNIKGKDKQSSVKKILPIVIKTWKDRKPKLHLSEQNQELRFGAHSDFIEIIPDIILDLGKKIDFDLMCECKEKESCLLYLRKKYPETK